jgi:hypothetical protein
VLEAIEHYHAALDQAQEMISAAAFEVAVLGHEASTTLMPWGAHTDAERDRLLQVNARQKNEAGYCAFLGCWQDVSDTPFCSAHGAP